MGRGVCPRQGPSNRYLSRGVMRWSPHPGRDLALVRKQDTLENGDLGVLVYGDVGEGAPPSGISSGATASFWCSPSTPLDNELAGQG